MFLFDFLQRNPIAESCARITWQQIFRKKLDTDTVGLTENSSKNRPDAYNPEIRNFSLDCGESKLLNFSRFFENDIWWFRKKSSHR